MAMEDARPVITGRTRLAGVIGWPVGHSLSPRMHNAALAASGIDAVYVPFGVPPARFAPFVRLLAGMNALGVNVTLPHKERAFRMCQTRSAEAERIGAVNTLIFKNGAIHGDNTDGRGFMASLKGKVRLAGGRAVLLGCGGGGRAVAVSLAGAGVASLTLVDIDAARRRALARRVRRLRPLEVRLFDPRDPRLEGEVRAARLVVNATPLGLKRTDPMPLSPAWLAPRACVMDLVYGERPTRWLRAAARRGCTVVEGREMLIRQGAMSFALWTGRPAPVALMRRALSGG